MPKVSIIVPVYKVERFLHRCVDSLISQTFRDFEIILVDDGSPDGSGKICDEYADKHSFIRSFHTENGGVSSARNYGIAQAKSEWICFVDSDDFVTENYLADFFQEESLSSEFLYVQKGYYRYNNLTNQTAYCGMNDDSLAPMYYGTESYIHAEFNHIMNSPCMKLFHREVIIDNSLAFDCAISLGEDHLFVLDYLLSPKIRSIKIIKGDAYRYVIYENERSLSSRAIPYRELLIYADNALKKRYDLIKRYDIRNEDYIKHIKIEIKTYRIRAMLSLISKEGLNYNSMRDYRKLYKLLKPFKGLPTSHFCGLRPFIGHVADISPVWLNIIILPFTVFWGRKMSKLIRGLIAHTSTN